MTEKKEHTQIQKSELAAIVAQIALDWDPEHAPSSRFKSADARAFLVARDVAAKPNAAGSLDAAVSGRPVCRLVGNPRQD